LVWTRISVPHANEATACASAAEQELRNKVPSKSASLKTLLPSASADIPDEADPPPVTEAAPPANDRGAAVSDLDPAAPGNTPKPVPSPAASRPQMAGLPGRVMPPPRAMAKEEQFAEGDHVVYPTHGVGKVERIATEEIAGHKLELIHITFQENRMTLRVPVTKARTAGLRKVATRKMFDEAMVVLRGRPRIKRTMWSRRAQEYEAKINSGDPLAVAEVVRDLHRNSGQPDQSFSERQIYEAAMDRLAAELPAVERIDKAAASVKLVEFLKTV
jgi:CarD family transcriptional regulator